MTRRHTRHCPSDLPLDRLIAGELEAREQQALHAHFAECSSCRIRHGELAAAHRAFAERAPPWAALVAPAAQGTHAAPAGAEERRPQAPAGIRAAWPGSTAHRLALGAGALAAAAALWVVSLGPRAPEGGSPPARDAIAPEIRTKGPGLGLDWVIRRGSEVFAPRAGEPVHPGDALRFSVRADRAGQVAILSLDGAGRVSVYHGWSAVGTGDRQLLPGAVQLDGVLGPEQVYAVFCAQTWPLAELQAAIAGDPERPRLPAGCDLERHELCKEPP